MYFPHLKKKKILSHLGHQSTEQNSLCYTVGSQQLSILYVVEYISQFQSLNSSYSSFPPWYPYICSLRLCLYFCFASKIIYTIFLDLLIIFKIVALRSLSANSLISVICGSSLISIFSHFESYLLASLHKKNRLYFLETF